MRVLFPFSSRIRRMENIEFVQASLSPSQPLITPEFHWEIPRVNLYGSVLKTEKGYEAFYQCGNAVQVAYATSVDGYDWSKPMVNLADFSAPLHAVVQGNTSIEATAPPDLSARGEPTNLVAGYHMPSVIYDPETPEPYKLFAFGEEGYRIAHSKDGLHFEEYPDNPAIPVLTFHNPATEKTWVSDVSPCYKDDAGYVAMVKRYEIDDAGVTRRCVGRSTSEDFIHWTTPETLWMPGPEEDRIAKARGFEWADFYGLCPFRYGDGYLGYLWLFEIEKELPNGTNQGKIEVFLAQSADGVAWSRLSDCPFIPWDLNYGSAGGMVTTPGAPIFDQDEIKVYYSDNNYEHGMFERDYTKEVDQPTWVIRCASIPKERLVGAHARQGVIQLVPQDITGKNIRINLNTSGQGADSGFIDIFWEDEAVGVVGSHRVTGDETDHLIQPDFDGEVSIRIQLNHATLYALELVERGY